MSELTGKEKQEKERNELDKRLASITDDKLPTANIIVAGITGTGKSTLLNAVFGSELAKTGTGRPVTDKLDEYYDSNIPVHIWDTVGLELDSDKTEKSIQSIKDTIAKKAESKDQFDRVHAIWYCINSSSHRYQGAELDFINELHSIGVPFIIVLTQCIGADKDIQSFEDEINKINKEKNMSDIRIVRVLAQDYSIQVGGNPITIPSFGLNDLINVTLNQLPAFIKSGFIAAQRVSKVEKRKLCERYIYEYCSAAVDGIYNIPIVNIKPTDDKIKALIKKIGKTYNTVLSEDSVNAIINNTDVNAKNNIEGLIFPILSGYDSQISSLLSAKQKNGYDVQVDKLPKNKRAARMIAFYGYTFMDSVEQLWEEFTESQLKNVDLVVDRLIQIINRKLNERVRRLI